MSLRGAAVEHAKRVQAALCAVCQLAVVPRWRVGRDGVTYCSAHCSERAAGAARAAAGEP